MITLIGDSHANVVAKGLAQDGAGDMRAAMLEVGRQFLRSFHKSSAKGVSFKHPKMAPRFKKLTGRMMMTPGERYYISLGFHGIAFHHAKSWSKLTINQDRNDRQLISRAAFKESVLGFNKHIFAFLADCQKHDIEVIIVAAPYLHKTYFDARKGRPMTKAEYHELDRRYREIVAQKYDEMGIPYILPPPACFDDGFLKPEFCRDVGDDYHGNEAYGLRVAEQIRAFETGQPLDQMPFLAPAKTPQKSLLARVGLKWE